MIVAALIHDIGDDVAPFNHAESRPRSCARTCGRR
jgi:predicted HD phosphohydrolase